MSHSTLTPSRMPRMNAAKPPSLAWMMSQRAGWPPAVRNECATPGGAATKPPAPIGDRLALGPDLEGELAFENVERLGVLVYVWVGHAFPRCAAGIGEAEVLRLRRGG